MLHYPDDLAPEDIEAAHDMFHAACQAHYAAGGNCLDFGTLTFNDQIIVAIVRYLGARKKVVLPCAPEHADDDKG